MNKIFIILISAMMVVTACSKTDFEEAYPDRSKLSVSTVEKQFSGFLQQTENMYSKLLELFCSVPNYCQRYTPRLQVG